MDDFDGRIKRHVYVSAYVPLENEALVDVLRGGPPTVPMDLDFVTVSPIQIVFGTNLADGTGTQDPGNSLLKEGTDDVPYHDALDAVRLKYTALLNRQPRGSFTSPPTTCVGWRWIPSTYIYTAMDRCLYSRSQQYMVTRARHRTDAARKLHIPGGRQSPVQPKEEDAGRSITN